MLHSIELSLACSMESSWICEVCTGPCFPVTQFFFTFLTNCSLFFVFLFWYTTLSTPTIRHKKEKHPRMMASTQVSSSTSSTTSSASTWRTEEKCTGETGSFPLCIQKTSSKGMKLSSFSHRTVSVVEFPHRQEPAYQHLSVNVGFVPVKCSL